MLLQLQLERGLADQLPGGAAKRHAGGHRSIAQQVTESGYSLVGEGRKKTILYPFDGRRRACNDRTTSRAP